MKQDKLKEFIDQNQEEFNCEVPSEHIWNKINDKLDEKENKRRSKKTILWYTLRLAAASVLVLVTYIFVTWTSHDKSKQIAQANTSFEDEQIAELMEAEAFYTNQVNTRQQEVFRLAANQPEVKQDIINDFLELDSAYADLKLELKENIANEQVIAAMIENYKMRLEILEDLFKRINKSNSTNRIRKEKTYEI